MHLCTNGYYRHQASVTTIETIKLMEGDLTKRYLT